jgi:hypothetical protein
MRPDEELREVIGLSLWDILSDGHLVIAADGRAVDIGLIHSASNFLDGCVGGDASMGRQGLPRFFLGTHSISRRADLTRVHAMIFRRLRSLGADWFYRLRLYGPADFDSWREACESAGSGGCTQAVPDHARQRQRAKDSKWFRSEFGAGFARGIAEMMKRPPPPAVLGYRRVYTRDPRGWPPF